MVIAISKTAIIAAPNIVPITDPDPPLILVPPITVAAMAVISHPPPEAGWADFIRAAIRSPVKAEAAPIAT